MIENRKVRWGIMGAGSIINNWIKGAMQQDDMEIVAIASRTRESAEKMAKRYQIPEVNTYDELAAREDIDVVYIPVPHPFHKELALKAMKAGKAVLVEKPATVNAADFEELMACAKKNQVFLMEAVWTRFNPLYQMLPAYFNENGIGEPRLIQSAFAFRIDDEQIGGRLTDPLLAGGGLLDTGVYCLHFTDMIYDKEPVKLTGLASFHSDDFHIQVDEQAHYVASFDKGELAVMTSAIRTALPDTAFIYGTKGSIEIPGFWRPTRMIVRIEGKAEEVVELPIPQKVEGIHDTGFQFEIAHVNDCLKKGLLESPVMTQKKSLQILRECDMLRAQWGLKYPFEK